MALEIEVYRSPIEAAADMTELVRIDWGQLFQGYQGQDPAEWTLKFGLLLDALDQGGGLHVRLGSGAIIGLGRLQNSPDGDMSRRSAGATWWRAGSGELSDNASLHDAADEAWGGYYTALCAAVGDPNIITDWSDPDFPTWTMWQDPQKRHIERAPSHLAIWRVNGGAIAVSADTGTNAMTTTLRGSAILDVDVVPSCVVDGQS